MSPLRIDDFPAFFEAVHRHRPFDWQMALAERVVTGEGWPDGIDVPTGLGKTAVIDVAVFALALQAGWDPDERTAPTRTFVVVDRRLIVDQSWKRAETIRERLIHAPSDTVVGRVAAALRRLNPPHPRDNPSPTPLEVVRMRGGATWSARWLSHPSQPAVVVATVDQFGSRVLFRGYGVSTYSRPIDAALCGADSLVILDEAHLSQSMIETLGAVNAQESRAERPVLPQRRVKTVLLSATLPPEVAVFRPDLFAETSDTARKRLDAERVAHLVALSTPKDASRDLAGAMATLALTGLERENIARVAVVCNTVRMARAVYDELARRGPGADLTLLVGRCRQVERDAIAGTWLPRLAAQDQRPPAEPVIAVATQTIEVGADLDFDFLVTEAAPVDALLQRLGRLNRFGLKDRAEAVVVNAPNRHDDDPVYGAATRRTWEWLAEAAGTPVPVKATAKAVEQAYQAGPTIELGPAALGTILSPAERRTLAAEPPLAPVVLGPVLDAWARTSPAPVPDQTVAPYLHGIARPAAEVVVCWRAGLPSSHDLAAWEEEVRTAPPTSDETVSVPIWEAARFLAGSNDSSPMSDMEGAAEPDEELDLDEREPVAAVLVSADGDIVKAGSRALRPGDTVVVPSDAGGHDEWGWTGRPGPSVPDVADLVQRRILRLRLRPEVLALDVAHSDFEDLCKDLASITRDLEQDGSTDTHRVRALLGRVAPLVTGCYAERIRSVMGYLGTEMRTVSRGASCAIVKGRPVTAHAGGGAKAVDRAVHDDMGDDDELSSSTAPFRVTLRRHLRDVASGAESQGRLVGLPDDLVKAVELAGRAHDLGKADERFQAMLHRGDVLAALASPEPLAKSGMDPGDRYEYQRAREQSKWPAGMRHEAISAALVAELARTSPGLFEGLDVDLVHHLVQSHHGRARPLLPPIVDDSPRPVVGVLPGPDAACQVASDRDLVDWKGPDRFARLGRRYGWWGLALLESMVRLADMTASKSYELKDRR